jgi:4Fe-4S ferredoxin
MVGVSQRLVLDGGSCVGCRDCQVVCPAEAVTSSEPLLNAGGLLKPVTVDLDEQKCHFCGQCAVICPTKAISWRENDEEEPAVQRRAILPRLGEEVTVDVGKCSPNCLLACEKSCPVKALRVFVESEGDPSETRITAVEVERNRCFYCHKCEEACPYKAISVRHARQGMVLFRPEACPAGCYACADICPSNAMRREDGVVRLQERLCIFCGACRNVCPVDLALEIKRERIAHHPVSSHLWTEMQGKLVSKEAKLRLMEDIARRKRQRAFRTRID